MLSLISRAFWIQDLIARAIRCIPSVAYHNLAKYWALKKAFFMNSLEGVSGDYLEFGVFTGSSMAAAMRMSSEGLVKRQTPCRFFGYDSFAGFGRITEEEQSHPFFKDQNFKTDFKSVEKRLRRACSDPSHLTLIKGFYDESLHGRNPSDHGVGKAAVVLIDCDTLTASTLVFDYLRDCLQEGTILLLDDYFSYRASTRLGIHGAFEAFKSKNPQWSFRRLFDYGLGGVAYVACK